MATVNTPVAALMAEQLRWYYQKDGSKLEFALHPGQKQRPFPQLFHLVSFQLWRKVWLALSGLH